MKKTFLSKVLPVARPTTVQGLQGQNTLTSQECKISSKEELDQTIDRMKTCSAAYRFDAYEPQLSGDETNLSNDMNATRALINSIIRSDTQASQYPPANPFYEVKQYIDDESQIAPGAKVCLKDTFRRMPKGGNLHIHTSATYNMERFIKDLKASEYANDIYVLIDDYLMEDQTMLPKGSMYYFTEGAGKIPGGYFKGLLNYTASDQNLKQLIQWNTLADNSDNYIDHIGYIWGGFNQIFARIDSILRIPMIYQMYYTNSFMLLMEDGLDYCELRCGIADSFVDNHNYILDKTKPVVHPFHEDDPEFFQLLKAAYGKALGGKDPSTFQLKLVLTANRGKAKMDSAIQKLQWTKKWMEDDKINSNPYPLKDIDAGKSKFILGFDLVSEEDTGASTKEFVDALFDSGQQDLLFTVPMYLHDGESNRCDDDNLYTAYLIGSERIGHGLNLYRSEYLEDMVKLNRNTLEVCPISNQVLRYIADLRIHPVYGYLNNGVPCVIASDDPQIFGNDGLTYDFWILYVASDLDLRGIKCLIRNSYQYSGMNEEEKKIMIDQWETKWGAFIQAKN